MPITQDRMIALIEDCARVEQARSNLVEALRQTIKYAGENLISPKEMADLVLLTLNSAHPPNLKNFWVEKAHFEKVQRKNEKLKRYMAGQRRMQGVPEAATARPIGREVPKEQVVFSPEYWEKLAQQEKEWEEDAKRAEPPKAGESLF